MKTIKNNVIPLVLGILVGVVVSYLFLREADDSTDPKYKMSTTSFVTKDTSIKWVNNYQQIWNNIQDSIHQGPKHKYGLPLQFFTVRSQDLLWAMGIDTAWQYKTKYRYVRVSIGYSGLLKELKAFVQPVDSVNLAIGYAGRALFFNSKGQIIDKNGNIIGKDGRVIGKQAFNPGDSLFVADLNTPCPATCGNQ
jgi:hypothetical protein